MSYENTLPVWQALSLKGWAIWILVAIAGGAVFALAGLPVIYAAIALATFIIFASTAHRFPMEVIGASIFLLALCPFNFGLQSGVVPKIFGDEVLLTLYLAVFPLFYLATSRRWTSGFSSLYILLALFMLTESMPLAALGKDLIAARTLLETCFLGALLCVLALQEVSNFDRWDTIASAIVWATVIIAALSVTERITQRNPIMEHQTDLLFLSPLIARITEGVYRPYVTFFHPSEAGTFMALGAPFALRRWLQNKSFLSYSLLGVVLAGVFVNATRGVWVGLAVAAIVLVPDAWLFVAALVPVAAVVATIVYIAFRDTPFMERLTDANNLLSRFEYWKIAVAAFADHPFVGVGHMQFPKIYLDYVHALSNEAHFDIGKISVVDNMYLTTLVEHGVLGVLSQIVLLVFLGRRLGKYFKALTASGHANAALLVRCCQAAVVIYAAAGCFADIHLFTKATKCLFIIVGMGFGVGARYSIVAGGADAVSFDSEHARGLQNA